MNNKLSKIQEITKKLLSIIGIEAEIEVLQKSEGAIINIICEEAGLLIGPNGESLSALQHLVKLIFAKEEEEKISFCLDINNYQQNKIEILKDFAIDKADQAVQERRNVFLRPMSSYERRIIHLALQNRQDVICESEGLGLERHIVIKAI